MKKASILFVDDEKMLIKSGKQALEMMGYEVTSTTSSVEALMFFQENPQDFDLVITDYHMPEMNGDELVMKLNGIRSDMPIILSTGGTDFSRETLKRWGISEIILKPYSLEEMDRLIEKILNSEMP